MNRYLVRLRHDEGTVDILINAPSAERAMVLVCEIEHAPARSVIYVTSTNRRIGSDE